MVDDDDGRTPNHGHPISSPCEPYGSGELIMVVDVNLRKLFLGIPSNNLSVKPK